MLIKKENKTSISFICIPNPPIPKQDDKKPCRFLVKVKTENDANELFEKLDTMKS